MKWRSAAITTLMMAGVSVGPVFGQQSGNTSSVCNFIGNQMYCTSRQKGTPSGGAGQLSPEAVKALLAEEKKEREPAPLH